MPGLYGPWAACCMITSGAMALSKCHLLHFCTSIFGAQALRLNMPGHILKVLACQHNASCLGSMALGRPAV